MKEKKCYEVILECIRYDILESIALILLLLFTINPFAKVFLHESKTEFWYMHQCNEAVLKIGVIIMFLYIFKLKTDGRLFTVKEFLKKNVAVVTFLLFGILMIVTTLLNGAPQIAVIGDYYRGEGLIVFLSYIVYFLLAAFLLTENKKSIIINAFLVTSLFVGIVIFVDYAFFDQKYNYAMADNMVFSQFNHLGYYLLMSIMFFGMMFVNAKKVFLKIAYLCGFMFMTVVLIMNDTWGCQLALFVGVIFAIIVCSIGKSKFQPITLVLVVAVLVSYLGTYFASDKLKMRIEANFVQQSHDTSALLNEENAEKATTGTARIALWKHAFEYTMERPLTGHGSDVTGRRLMKEAGNDRCHCEYLNYAVSFGIPAAIVYIVAVFMVFLRGLKKKKQLTDMNYAGLCVAFAYLASALVGNTMYYTAPFLFIALGMGYVKNREMNAAREI